METNLRLCAGCNRDFLAYPSEAPFWCGACRKRRLESFDPRPGSIVRLLDTRGDWVILSRGPETVIVKRLGFPDSTAIPVAIGRLDALNSVR